MSEDEIKRAETWAFGRIVDMFTAGTITPSQAAERCILVEKWAAERRHFGCCVVQRELATDGAI